MFSKVTGKLTPKKSCDPDTANKEKTQD